MANHAPNAIDKAAAELTKMQDALTRLKYETLDSTTVTADIKADIFCALEKLQRKVASAQLVVAETRPDC